MNPIRLLAMTTAHPVAWGAVGYSTVIPEITPAIAAGMCAGMDPRWYAAARLKWADDRDQKQYLVYSLMFEFIDYARKWEKRTPGITKKLVELAINEVESPSKYDRGSWRADEIGMRPDAFRRTWSSRYEMIYQQLEQWAARSLRVIQNNQIDEYS